MLVWLDTHPNMAGWAQFAGSILALAVTYLTAFGPIWKRKRQLQNAVQRLIAHGYEAVESYHRTSEYGDLYPISLRQAALSMGMVAEDMGRFPVYDLDDHGSNSLARRLTAMCVVLGSLRLAIETMAVELDGRPATTDDRENLRYILGIGLSNAEALVTGVPLTRPEPPGTSRHQ